MSTIAVKIVKIGEAPKEVGIASGSSVRDAIVAANITNPDAFSVRYIGSHSEIALTATLREDTTIVLTKKENITGGLN